MTREEALLGWLVICRHQLDSEGHTDFALPEEVKAAWTERGWAALGDAAPGDPWLLTITEQGRTVSDLAAPEWFIDPVGSPGEECGPNG